MREKVEECLSARFHLGKERNDEVEKAPPLRSGRAKGELLYVISAVFRIS